MKEHFAPQKEEIILAWVEGWKAYFLERAYTLENGFYTAFYVQCAESTAADAYEVFLEDKTQFNYFAQRLDKLDEGAILRFFKLAAIHHTIRAMKRRKKELVWEEMKAALFQVYGLNEGEISMTEIFCRAVFAYQSGFQELFLKTTPRYLFREKELSAFSFAFIGNFWYNSYSSFMGSFTGYVPFHVRMERAAGQ